MVKVSDGQTDLVSTLLQTSQDAQGKQIKWKLEDGSETSLPSWSAEVKNDDGSKSIFSLSLSKALGQIGVNTELSEAQKKAQEKRAGKTNVRDGKVLQNNPVSGKPSRTVEDDDEKDTKEDKEALKRAEKESESGFTKSGSKFSK